jgi:hypothetical protein
MKRTQQKARVHMFGRSLTQTNGVESGMTDQWKPGG